MRRSLSDASARQELVDRLDRLFPEAKPLWGKMTAPQMLAHLADWMLMAKGALKAARMTPKAWYVLGYRHMDHHLRQFGV